MPTINGVYYPDAATPASQATWAAAMATSIATPGTLLTYTPVITSTTTAPSLGSGGSATGAYLLLPGRVVRADIKFLWGTSLSAGVGNYSFSLPVAADLTIHSTSGTFGAGDLVGIGGIRDNSTGSNNTTAVAYLDSASTVRLAYPGGAAVGASAPLTWAASDRIVVSVTYIAA